MPSATTRRAGEDRAIVELISSFLTDQGHVVSQLAKRLDTITSSLTEIEKIQVKYGGDLERLSENQERLAKEKKDQNGKLYKTIDRVDEIEKRHATHDGAGGAYSTVAKALGHILTALIGGGGMYIYIKLT